MLMQPSLNLHTGTLQTVHTPACLEQPAAAQHPVCTGKRSQADVVVFALMRSGS